ncbi:hypothetical protein L7F22_063750 [Adiantum nelumboides]|nr:hypothetical protein [Adiantum nelumboides]
MMLSHLTTNGGVVGLSLPCEQQLVGQALTDDTFMFLKTDRKNIRRAMDIWNLFALAFGLYINTTKSAVISCTEQDLLALGWQGEVLIHGYILDNWDTPWVYQILSKQLLRWNAEFYKYRDNFRKAKELASSKNVEALAAFCNEQVENMLRCWISDLSFRERYVRNNVHSTLRRLETLDGRSLGIDEEPLLLLNDAELDHETQAKDVESGSKKVGLRKEAIAKSPVSLLQENNVKGLRGVKVQQPQGKVLQESSSSGEPKEEVAEAKKSGSKSSQSSSSSGPPSSLTSTPTVFTTPAPIKDEAAKEAQAAELKETRRQEEMAKAKEAAERKRRQAERAQAKAQLRAQKDAERREKERAKKAKRKAAVGIEDVKTAETVEDTEKELDLEELTSSSVRESPSSGKGFVGKQLRSQRNVWSRVSRRRVWQLSSTWLWVSLIIILMSLALIFVARLWS